MSRSIGNYRVDSEIGSGGFGRVYRGRHSILTEREVAIKILHSHLSSPEERDQFLQEAHVLEKLKHPHILHVFDVGVDEGFPYLISEYAPNGSLRDLLKRQPQHRLSEQDAIALLTQVGAALYYAHQQGIIHRDLKPENVLFNAEHQAFLADFGIATTLTTASVKQVSIMGTPTYMAPEQFKGEIARESDQYALGCIAYELVTGQQPFEAPDFFAMGFQHMMAVPTPPTQLNPTLSVAIERAILKVMAKQRSERYTDVQAFIAALQAASPAEAYNFSSELQANIISPQSNTFSTDSMYTSSFNSTGNTRAVNESKGPIQGNNDLTLPSSKNAAIQPQPSITPHLPLLTPHLDEFTQIRNQESGTTYNSSTQIRNQGPLTPRPPVFEEHAGMFAGPPSLADYTSATRIIEEAATPFGQSGGISRPFPFTDVAFGSGNHTPLPPSIAPKRRSSNYRWPIIAIVSFLLAISIVGAVFFTAFAHDPNSPLGLGPAGPVTAPQATATASAQGFGPSGPATHATPGKKGTPNSNTTILTPGATPPPGTTPTAGPNPTPTTGPGTPTPTPTFTPTPTDTPTPTPTPTDTPTPTPISETVTASFAGGSCAGSTKNSYSGTITIQVSGDGQAYDVTAYSDAFYVYTDASGNAVTPYHRTTYPSYTLIINGYHPEYYGISIPAYNSSHGYTFQMTAPGGTLCFGVEDNVYSDDTGGYTITVTQG